MPDSEKEKSGIRLGWSNLHSGVHALQLGNPHCGARARTHHHEVYSR